MLNSPQPWVCCWLRRVLTLLFSACHCFAADGQLFTCGYGANGEHGHSSTAVVRPVCNFAMFFCSRCLDSALLIARRWCLLCADQSSQGHRRPGRCQGTFRCRHSVLQTMDLNPACCDVQWQAVSLGMQHMMALSSTLLFMQTANRSCRALSIIHRSRLSRMLTLDALSVQPPVMCTPRARTRTASWASMTATAARSSPSAASETCVPLTPSFLSRS